MSTAQAKKNTIAAIASALGGAVAVIRISGPEAVSVTDKCWFGSRPLARSNPREMLLGNIRDQDEGVLDQVMAVKFVAPGSYTGEEMVELHCHGGALSARQVLLQLLEKGADPAQPGEFTKRAFLNGKMDLTQAEAVADIINAHSTMALRLATRQLEGCLGRRTEELYDNLVHILSETESRLDFPEEELDWIPGDKMQKELQKAEERVDELLASKLEGEVLRQGIRMVIAGPPNVGKSMLLNAVLGRDRAIVTELPGTTRDTLEELAHIRGIPIRFIDTAGIREAENLVEKSGIDRSVSSIQEAQVVLWVSDVEASAAEQGCPYALDEAPVIKVVNKCDKLKSRPAPGRMEGEENVYISALTGEGLEGLYDKIEKTVWNAPHRSEPEAAVSARHAALLEKAKRALEESREQCKAESWELLAVNLRDALDVIGRITGRTAGPDVLEDIFSRFCIGK